VDQVQFEYRLTGHGWSEARLQIGESWIALTASYPDDALGDLVRGVLALARGAHQIRVSWAEQPGEYRWVLTAQGSSVNVVSFGSTTCGDQMRTTAAGSC
jgi:hypothetical protein